MVVLATVPICSYNPGMSTRLMPTQDELEAIMDASDADYEAGRFVSGEVVAARIQAALDRYEADHQGDNHTRAARRR
ncbi:MAG TPA: hypothetical protein HPQ04_10250 [Rhodospirillaceae bacterium]|nr:hypothetical protein [Rhodospirillaceae bacterium]